ncbi:MAG: twin-arginine translocase TatA/TatE family subunit [Actinomycetota bacterium]
MLAAIGPPEIILIVLAIVLLFGARKLPELARSLGRSSKEFKAGMKEGAVDDDEEPDEAPSKSKPKPVSPE